MTSEKICPFMSQPIHYGDSRVYLSGMVYCKHEDCMAWRVYTPVDDTDTVRGGDCRLIP